MEPDADLPITHLTFGLPYRRFQTGAIPPTVTHLTIGQHFNQPLRPNVIPDSVTHLVFDLRYGQIIAPNVIPSSVTHLKLGDNFDQTLVPGIIPLSVTHLIFGYRFNKPLVDEAIPPSVMVLEFGELFFQKIPDTISIFTKIRADVGNYELFLHHGFVQVNVELINEQFINCIDDNEIIINENRYEIYKQVCDNETKVSFRLHTDTTKSARKS